MRNRFFASPPPASMELDGKEIGGRFGEDRAARVIESTRNACYVRNPIVPYPRAPGRFTETDFLVYTRGTLYCVEIKNHRGRIYYTPGYITIYRTEGWFIFKRHIPQVVQSGYDYGKMIQETIDEHGQKVTRDFPNPWLKTQRYIDNLKYYLHQINPELAKLPIYPILAFDDKADISAIHQFDAGIVRISELPAFFARFSNPAYESKPAPWIEQQLRSLPTWDLVLTTTNRSFNGVLAEPFLRFRGINRRDYTIPYQNIVTVDIRQEPQQEVVITYTSGEVRTFPYTDGSIRLNRFKGEQQTHQFGQIRKVTVGVANKFRA